MQDSIYKTSTIEGGSSTGDPSIGGSNLKLAITANHDDTECFNESFNNRGGGGGGQSPPTPTVGKTLLNTSANLLPITTASDTFNNLKNILKIDKGSSPTSNGIAGSHQGGSGNRSKEVGGTYKRSPNSGESARNSLNGGRSGAPGASGHFSTGYSKNSAKIRQHDSEVSPRPRRSFQNDSSSSRYYNKNSDILGGSQAGGLGSNTNSNPGGNPYSNNTGGRGGSLNANSGLYNNSHSEGNSGGGGRRNYQPHNSDGGYSRNLNSGGSGSSYRSHQGQRYENGNGNGQQRQYGSSTNAGYNNNYHNYNNKSYGPRSSANDGNVNSYRSSHQRERGDRDRDDYNSGGGINGNNNNYRDYEDSPRSVGGGGGGAGSGRYTNGNPANGVSTSGSNTNSLERRLPPSALRSSGDRGGSGGVSYDHRERDRSTNNRSPPTRGGIDRDNVLGRQETSSGHSSNVNSSSSSRGISPNSGAGASALPVGTTSQQPTPAATPPPSAGRWVPPSLRPQHGLTQAEKNDAVFRRVSYCTCVLHENKIYIRSRTFV